MIIKTNIYGLLSADKILSGGDVQLIIQQKSVFQMASEDPIPDMILTENVAEAERAMNQFPAVKFCAPGLSFPGLNYNFQQGFDPLQLKFLEPKELYGTEVVLFNRRPDSMIFVKKIESLGYSLKVFGEGYGIATCGSIPQEFTGALYKSNVICAANEIEEIMKINSLGKVALTPFDFENCINVFNLQEKVDINLSSVNPETYKDCEWDNLLKDNHILSIRQSKKIEEWKKKILESGQ